MILCPSCGVENIDGADSCEKCQTPLVFLSKHKPSSWIERSILKDRISSLLPRTPLVVDPNTPIADVLRCLADNRVGCVIVTRDDKPVGIFSERDALMKLNTQCDDALAQPVSNFMTTSPECVRGDDRIALALHKMDLGGYRHVPVVDDSGEITGIISVRDILRYISEDLLLPA